MNLKSFMADKVKSSVTDSMKQRDRMVNLFASSVVQALNEGDIPVGEKPMMEDLRDNPPERNMQKEQPKEAPKDSKPQEKPQSKIDGMSADKQAYFITLALRDIKNIIEVANFNLKNALRKSRPSITDVYFDRNGSASVDVVVPFDYQSEEANKEDFSNITGAFDLELRNEYKDLVSYKVSTPTVSHPQVSLELTITIPKALMQEIGVGNYDTRTKVLAKFVDNLIKKELI